ncbi:hypothetical protein HNR42_003128 [Deinobacterium chartae]|uniref:Uncharacterized protein n=1 Tax=Deinobacterium chartae TaxID=521158 RepID=A0A841I5F7_9DEIO|nr:hypothetical protein [Deinobacterium chartae]MBB6099670.1 hypothetical protein [Deinobacterium chartae]
MSRQFDAIITRLGEVRGFDEVAALLRAARAPEFWEGLTPGEVFNLKQVLGGLQQECIEMAPRHTRENIRRVKDR